MGSFLNISKRVEKEILKLPKEIQESFKVWAAGVLENGLASTNAQPGYNAEHLSGNRKGQRSIRLNKAYRVIYVVENGNVQIVTVLEVNKHKY